MDRKTATTWHGISREHIEMKLGRTSWMYFLLLVALISLTEGQANTEHVILTPRSTCTECEITATRVAGIATAWSMQLDPAVNQTQDQVVVRAVMFWMDACGHCHYILDDVLPSLQAKYGEKLELLLIEINGSEEVDLLYQTATALGVSQDRVTVPFLIIGDQVLIGSKEIPAELPGLIEDHLAAGGLDYPALQPLAAILPVKDHIDDQLCVPETPCPDEGTFPEPTPIPDSTNQSPSGLSASLSSPGEPSPHGFVLAIIILIGMIISLGFTGFVFMRQRIKPAIPFAQNYRSITVPLLAVLGLGVAGYLAYVEISAVQAFCGPVGDCDTVQSSTYARLFGVFPIGILGFAGYLAILAVWYMNRLRPERFAFHAQVAIFMIALIGTLFSIYLTFLELYVIRAICMRCLTSAVILTLLLLASLPRSMLLSLNPKLPIQAG